MEAFLGHASIDGSMVPESIDLGKNATGPVLIDRKGEAIMLVSGGGYSGPREIKYLFIDGGCLRQMADEAGSRYPGFDFACLDFAKLVSDYTKTFYYDSLPPRKTNEDEASFSARTAAREALFDNLRAIRGVHVYEGDTRRRRKTVEQKKVDVMIAVDMLTHSFRRNMHQAALLTATRTITSM